MLVAFRGNQLPYEYILCMIKQLHIIYKSCQKDKWLIIRREKCYIVVTEVIIAASLSVGALRATICVRVKRLPSH